ncbi:MAG: DNA primase, partial [Clostridia bacterium]|nr:DNA primase [Clostridia bacterium]
MDESKVIDAEWHDIEGDEDDETIYIDEAETEDSEPEYPIWYDGKHLDEVKFCDAFLGEHPMICVRGEFFTVDGPVGDEDEIRKQILDIIKPVLTSGLAKTARNLLNALRIECWSPPLPIQRDRIHFANGTLMLDGGFTEEKDYCLNRLPIRYDPEASEPKTWLRFLDELLYPEDIPTLQEYMGYCLIPSTKGQKMLLLKGKGGEGKSRIGLVMQAIFGRNMKNGSIAKVEASPFARADLENELVMVDDDMKLEALAQTHHVKSIVTAEMPMDLERKGVQSYQGQMFVRFMAFGNGDLQSLYDHSDGFYRRQLILSTRDKPADRKDDPFLAEKLCTEAEGIVLWAIEGLRRLIANDYAFTVSDRAKANLSEVKKDANNIL